MGGSINRGQENGDVRNATQYTVHSLVSFTLETRQKLIRKHTHFYAWNFCVRTFITKMQIGHRQCQNEFQQDENSKWEWEKSTQRQRTWKDDCVGEKKEKILVHVTEQTIFSSLVSSSPLSSCSFLGNYSFMFCLHRVGFCAAVRCHESNTQIYRWHKARWWDFFYFVVLFSLPTRRLSLFCCVCVFLVFVRFPFAKKEEKPCEE